MDVDYEECMSKKISIVMAYYNRLEQLRFTLSTIKRYSQNRDVEVVITDDASSAGQRAEMATKASGLNINLVTIQSNEKIWLNPCHVFNLGFKRASGDIIILQNPECFHCGDIIGHALENVNDEKYVVYSCKNSSGNEASSYRLMSSFVFDTAMQNLKQRKDHWYNHPSYNPTCYHFLSALTKKNLDKMGGFDERYANGYSFDDNEFLERVKRSPMNLTNVPPDFCFCVHQWHECTHPKDGNKDEGWKRNHRLFVNCTKIEQGWTVNDS